eukprot:1154411-Pelagomonas_calceolata.AAC.3
MGPPKGKCLQQYGQLKCSTLTCTALSLPLPGAQHQDVDCLSRMPRATTADATGARLHEPSALRCTVTAQLATLASALSIANLHNLYELPTKTTFTETFAPISCEMASNVTDAPLAIQEVKCLLSIPVPPPPKLLPPNMCIGGNEHNPFGGCAMPNLSASLLACSSTPPPTPLQQDATAKDTEAAEIYQQGAASPADIWKDRAVLDYIMSGSMEADTPAHEKLCIQRRAKVCLWH